MKNLTNKIRYNTHILTQHQVFEIIGYSLGWKVENALSDNVHSLIYPFIKMFISDLSFYNNNKTIDKILIKPYIYSRS